MMIICYCQKSMKDILNDSPKKKYLSVHSATIGKTSFLSYLVLTRRELARVLFLFCKVMRSIPESFYNSTTWKRCRASYIQAHSLCEECLKRGKITPAKYVHHITHLTMDNYKDEAIAYDWNNLQALCFDCHEHVHGRIRKRRYEVDELGRVTQA